MSVEQLVLEDYDKGMLVALCVDVLLTSIERSHPNLHSLLCDKVGDILTDEEVIDVLREIIED